MTLRLAAAIHLLQLAVLRCASLLVPGRQRSEWWKEWRAEMWHVRQCCTPLSGFSWIAEQEIARFCLGAFPDALCLRGQFPEKRIPRATTMGSAAQCLLLLFSVAVACFGLALSLPGVSLVRHYTRYHDTHNLMLIQDAGLRTDSVPTISVSQYAYWKHRRQDIFDDFAFYRVIPGLAANSGVRTGAGNIALASPNFFSLLGLTVRFTANDADPPSELSGLVLSDASWKRDFNSDRHVAGRIVPLGTKTAVVLGVAPEGSWRLPGKVDGWLLTPDSRLPRGSEGFVLAHLKRTSEHAHWGENWHMTARTPDGSMGDFFCSSLTERSYGPFGLYWFAVFLACLALPATTSLPLGEYRISSQKLTWSKRLRRWGFLACKLALLLPIVYFAGLDLAYLRPATDPFTSQYIQIVTSFSLCLFSLRWMLRDQRQRCPVCLRRLTHPARVGQSSRIFLAWNGTELICLAGHGLLHIPELQTSWFASQRWLYLDPSWDVLFAEPGLASASYF